MKVVGLLIIMSFLYKMLSFEFNIHEKIQNNERIANINRDFFLYL